MKIKATCLMLIGLLLTGCVAAVIVGAAGMIVYDRRSMTTLEHDARIFYEINRTIEHLSLIHI